MAEASFYIGVIGNVISVLVFLSPVETFWKIVKRRSTEEYKSLPYICTLLGSSLWTYYGIVTPGEYLVSTVNGFGALVETIYVSLFLFYAPRHLKLKTVDVEAMLNVFFPIAAIVATRSAFEDEKMRSQSIGFISAGLNIIMYGSPLSAMKTVVTTKSVKYMPFWLSFFLFLNGAIWAVYALLQHDVFLLVPNGVGFVFGTMQLILYGIYRNAKPVGLSNGLSEIAQDEEEGLTSRVEPLLS
ncbi:Nodulin MtN3 family protein [Arabidopsis thaliana]|uniref:Nodulin MtN3 family protein n=1 Tax=Arabidopsis thaliana TaxID=3702 RepID=UPI0001A7B0D3|nr:Nodulin MtN3 family protein [Arabidopsis thaliana]AEE83666.1 Nodulin MtN3 family protein [Arabidopsis thaliana]|eukprot:NP_193327.5 Nodulin MtN3 family protein [Arabidopsis thaliana]